MLQPSRKSYRYCYCFLRMCEKNFDDFFKGYAFFRSARKGQRCETTESQKRPHLKYVMLRNATLSMSCTVVGKRE